MQIHLFAAQNAETGESFFQKLVTMALLTLQDATQPAMAPGQDMIVWRVILIILQFVQLHVETDYKSYQKHVMTAIKMIKMDVTHYVR